MQQTLTLSFTVPFAALAAEPNFAVGPQEPNAAGSYPLPVPTGGIAPWTFSVAPGKSLPAGWAVSPGGVLSWTLSAAQAAAGTSVNLDGLVAASDSGS